MPDIVTLEEARTHLRLGNSPRFDDILAPILAGAIEAALLQADAFDPATDDVPASLKLAVLQLVSDGFTGSSAANSLGPDRLLHRFRRMTV